jgi:hypothetical protein
VQWHGGVSIGVVHRWRKALDVTRTNNARSHELQKPSARAGAEAQQARVWTDAERQAKRERRRPSAWHGTSPRLPRGVVDRRGAGAARVDARRRGRGTHRPHRKRRARQAAKGRDYNGQRAK